MKVINDVHQQFAEYFPSKQLAPYLYLLSKKLSEGHICIDISSVDKIACSEPGYTSFLTKEKLLAESLISNGDTIAPFILLNERLYLQRYFNYESIILNRIKEFVETESAQLENKLQNLEIHKAFIKSLFENTSNETKQGIKWQLAAVINALVNNFTIITGGPGTGKTTTVAKILSILYTINPNLKVALTAPTGKAAARMKESLENAKDLSPDIKSIFETLQPATIHRLLGVIKNSPHFKINRDNLLNYDVVIADESSMIDVALFAKLLSAIGPNTKLILLGDKDQLASVEAGSMFGDLCEAQLKLNLMSTERAKLINAFMQATDQEISTENIDNKSTHPLFQHIIELQHSHRFNDDKGIGKFSKAIINNQASAIKEFFENTDDQVTIDATYDDNLFDQFISGYKTFILEEDTYKVLEKINELRVLCAVREGEQGLYAINNKIEKYLHLNKLINLTSDFYENRLIMITSNNKELGLFNGDIGIIRRDANGALKAWFQDGKDKIKSVLPGYISDVETVFAMTIHKSQGSEFNKVLVVLPKGEDIKLLTRELLYTAVTRAKENVLVQGSEALILETANAKVERGSGIIERFKAS